MKSGFLKNLPETIGALITVVGLSIFVRGVWMAYKPGGWMVAGIAIAAPATFWLYGQVRKAAVAKRGR